MCLPISIKDRLEEGPVYFPEDAITDHPERFIVSEIIREKLLLYLREEVPHGIAVEIESYEEEENLTRIGAVVYCEKKSHKSIIIGKGGRKLKGIGKRKPNAAPVRTPRCFNVSSKNNIGYTPEA